MTQQYTDITITCDQCQQTFVWTQGEQQFYQQKGLSKPSKCMICRAMVKQASKDAFRGKMKNT